MSDEKNTEAVNEISPKADETPQTESVSQAAAPEVDNAPDPEAEALVEKEELDAIVKEVSGEGSENEESDKISGNLKKDKKIKLKLPSGVSFSNNVQAAIKSLEIQDQEGVVYDPEKGSRVPGRFPIMPLTVLSCLSSTLGFIFSFVHFTVIPNGDHFLIPLLVCLVIFYAQIGLYHSGHRTQRHGRAFCHFIITLLMSALLTWSFTDRLATYGEREPHIFLILAIICFDLIPLVMLAHWTYLGRSYRWVKDADVPHRAKS